jgi:hypothetical protein
MSNYTYADGAIHNDHHKEMTINVSGKTDIAALMKAFMADDAEVVEEVQETAQPVCPTELQTQEAEKLFEKLREAGMVDARMQPLNLSNAEKGMLAFELAGRLDIQNQWQVFATLWGTTPGALRSAYNRAIEQQKTMLFIEKIKSILN